MYTQHDKGRYNLIWISLSHIHNTMLAWRNGMQMRNDHKKNNFHHIENCIIFRFVCLYEEKRAWLFIMYTHTCTYAKYRANISHTNKSQIYICKFISSCDHIFLQIKKLGIHMNVTHSTPVNIFVLSLEPF